MASLLIFLVILEVGSVLRKYNILQRWDDKWGTYVDVSDTDEPKTGDHLVCTLQQSQDNASSLCGTVNFDTSKGKVSI